MGDGEERQARRREIEALIHLLRAAASAHPDLAEEIGAEINYFETNKERMRYPEFREQGLFVGSGVIEAGCKTVLLGRMKRSGMFWTVRGANTIIALREWQIRGLLGIPPGAWLTLKSRTHSLNSTPEREVCLGSRRPFLLLTYAILRATAT